MVINLQNYEIAENDKHSMWKFSQEPSFYSLTLNIKIKNKWGFSVLWSRIRVVLLSSWTACASCMIVWMTATMMRWTTDAATGTITATSRIRNTACWFPLISMAVMMCASLGSSQSSCPLIAICVVVLRVEPLLHYVYQWDFDGGWAGRQGR